MAAKREEGSTTARELTRGRVGWKEERRSDVGSEGGQERRVVGRKLRGEGAERQDN